MYSIKQWGKNRNEQNLQNKKINTTNKFIEHLLLGEAVAPEIEKKKKKLSEIVFLPKVLATAHKNAFYN